MAAGWQEGLRLLIDLVAEAPHRQKLGGDRLGVDAGQADGKLDLIDAGHSTWEDASEECAEIVTGWWKGGHARA